jgi:hypothetical protein
MHGDAYQHWPVPSRRDRRVGLVPAGVHAELDMIGAPTCRERLAFVEERR